MKPLLKRVFRRTSSNRGQQLSGEEEEDTASQSPSESDPHRTSSTSLPPPHVGQLGLVKLDIPALDDSQEIKTYNVDIVAIHGLNGDIRRTWTHKNGTFWLQDLLPISMPGCRIFSYGYPSKVFLNPSVGGVGDYARHLLSSLDAERQSETQPRPIIFVCHSLGGIVFKQAMNVAFDQFELWRECKGVVFLGTPHRGSSSASLATLFGNIANVAWSASGARHIRRGISTDLLRNLKQNSTELNNIGEFFTTRAGALKIESFYEMFTTTPARSRIVEKSSAVIGVIHEKFVGLNADHRDLCRFESQDSDNYKLVLRGLKRIAEEILKEGKEQTSSINSGRSLDDSEKVCVKALNTLDIAAFESGLDRRVDGTLSWFLDNPQYTTWLVDRKARLLMVTGHTGCGKTILSSYIVHSLTTNSPSQTVVCRFFCRGTIQAQRDAVILLQNLIYQIVKPRRKLLRLVKKASDLQGLYLFSRFDALWDLFLEILGDEKAGAINIVIDAIDECDEETQKLVMERIIEVTNSEVATSVKFFITSRPATPAVHILEDSSAYFIRVSLEEKQEMVSEDINLVIRQRLESFLKRGICEEKTRQELEKVLINKADRTFLWVSLVLELLEKRRHLMYSEIGTISQQLPETLPAVYQGFLELIPRDDRPLAGKLLRILVSKLRPLTVDEISILLTIGPSHRTVTALDADRSLSKLESIRRILGPLIRVMELRIDLIHVSLKEYLIELFQDASNPLSADFGIDLQHETMILAQSCLRYLILEDFENDIFTDDLADTESSNLSIAPLSERVSSDEASLFNFDLQEYNMLKEVSVVEADLCTVIAARYQLFDYAATHWPIHFAQSNEKAPTELQELAITLCAPGTNQLNNWFRYYWAANGSHEAYPKAMDPLVISGYFDHSSTLRRLLNAYSQGSNYQRGPAVYWASRRGHALCVELLLADPNLEVKSCYVNGQSPLAVASEHDHEDCVRALLASGYFDINETGPRSRTPLALASSSGFDRTTAVLLSSKDVDGNLADRNGATPLFGAVWANSVKTLRLLLADPRIDVNWVDKGGRDALSWAAEEGYVEIAKELLKSPRFETKNRDTKGRTPLSYAAQHGHLDVAQLLVRNKRVDMSESDSDGRNAISWAASQPKYRVLHYLLKYDPEGADVQDKDGWTPLAWAMNPPGYADNISILIQSGLIDINRCSLHGTTVLSYAASYGYSTITQMLLQAKDIDPDPRDEAGCSPLSQAAGSGNLDALQLLIGTGRVEVDLRNRNGRTPLSFAARAGHLEVVRVLLATPGVDVNARDKGGRAPIDYAREFERHDVVLALEQAI